MRIGWIVATLLLLAGCGGVDEVGDGQTTAGAQDETADACGKDTWLNYAGKFFKSECQSCHHGAFASATSVISSGARAKISSGEMPKGKPLTAAKKKRILNWFACGSP